MFKQKVIVSSVDSSLVQEQLSEMNDERIYQLCRKFGEQALYWRKKFIGLLPEVYRRRLYEKKGFSSIFEFAAKLGGVSEEQVRLVLNLERKFENKPLLKSLLVSGEVSANKLARVAWIATQENQEFWANQAKMLSKTALETLVRDERNGMSPPENIENKNVLQKPLFEPKSLPGHSNLQLDSELSNRQEMEVRSGLLAASKTLYTGTSILFQDIKLLGNFSEELKQKLGELAEKGIDINALFLEFLQKREEEIQAEKERLSAEAKLTNSRYVKVAVKNLLRKEYGTQCSMKGCNKTAAEIHHLQRFGLSKIHDAKYMAPFCKNHHAIAHTIDVQYQEKKWRGFG